jgi:deoxyadenosine/deoxycytidine kinase
MTGTENALFQYECALEAAESAAESAAADSAESADSADSADDAPAADIPEAAKSAAADVPESAKSAADSADMSAKDRKAPLVVSLEGLIGAGKSTLLALITAALRARGLRVAVVPEPVELWASIGATPGGLLAEFYADPARYVYLLQTVTFATHVQTFRELYDPAADVVLCERGPWSGPLFWACNSATATEDAAFALWRDTFAALLPFDPAAVRAVYLRPSLDACMARLAARGRRGEAVSAAYQAGLLAAHEAYFAGGPSVARLAAAPFAHPALVVATDEDFRGGGAAVDTIVEHVLSLRSQK